MAWKYVQYNGETGKRRTVEGGSGGASSFSELEDVDFSNLQNGQVPKYNSSTQKWENADESGGTVTDVQVNGTSVVNQQGEAEITSYKEVTQAEYNALPESKETDGVLYCIKDVGGADSFPPLIYSDEEREIGVWRDGKPLYQKTYDLGSDTSISYNSWTEVNATYPTNCELIVRVDCNTSGGTYASGISVGRKANGKFEMQTGRNGNAQNIRYFTIFYTKSSDTPGSGTWTTQGGYAHHYSTSEKVIGTWIDGKPIYEITKTADTGNATSASIQLSTTIADVINITGRNLQPSGNIVSVNYYAADTDRTICYFRKSDYTIQIRTGSDYGKGQYAITVQYTKTTD